MCERDSFTFSTPASPKEYVELFKNYYGPTMNAFEAAEQNNKADNLQQELLDLVNSQNQNESDGTKISATFLRVTVEC